MDHKELNKILDKIDDKFDNFEKCEGKVPLKGSANEDRKNSDVDLSQDSFSNKSSYSRNNKSEKYLYFNFPDKKPIYNESRLLQDFNNLQLFSPMFDKPTKTESTDSNKNILHIDTSLNKSNSFNCSYKLNTQSPSIDQNVSYTHTDLNIINLPKPNDRAHSSTKDINQSLSQAQNDSARINSQDFDDQRYTQSSPNIYKNVIDIHNDIVKKTQLEIDWIENPELFSFSNRATKSNFNSKELKSINMVKKNKDDLNYTSSCPDYRLNLVHTPNDINSTQNNVNYMQNDVLIIGEIEGAEGFCNGNALFCLIEFEFPTGWGISEHTKFSNPQQTMTSYPEEDGFYIWNHPINLRLLSDNLASVPKLIFTIWCLDNYNTVSTVACGKIELPTSSGSYKLICRTWKQTFEFSEFVNGYFLNKKPHFDKSLINENVNGCSIERVEPCGVVISNIEVILNSTN